MILGLIFWLKSLCKGGRKRPPIGKPGDKMPLMATKRVCFVRHGQGEHNVSPKNWSLVDPPLNETGQKQVLGLHEVLKPQLKVPAPAPVTARARACAVVAAHRASFCRSQEFDLVVTSPITRAMQTMQGGFKGECAARLSRPRRWLLTCAVAVLCGDAGYKGPIMVQPLLRERLGAPCDFGRSLTAASPSSLAHPPTHAPCDDCERAVRCDAGTYCGRSRTELLKAFPDMKNWEGVDAMPEVWWSTVRAAHPAQPTPARIPRPATLGPPHDSARGPVPHATGRPCLKSSAASAAAVVRDAAARAGRGPQGVAARAAREDHRRRRARRPLLAHPRLPPQKLRHRVGGYVRADVVRLVRDGLTHGLAAARAPAAALPPDHQPAVVARASHSEVGACVTVSVRARYSTCTRDDGRRIEPCQ